MAITVPQFSALGDGGTNQLIVTLGAGVTAGSILAVSAWFNSGVNLTSIVDGSGDSITDSGTGIITNASAGTKTVQRAFLTPTAGVTTVTLNLSASAFCAMCVFEVAGLTTPSFDKFKSNTSAGASTWVGTPTGVLTNAAEFAFGVVSTNNFVLDGTTGWVHPNGNGLTNGQDSIGGFHEYLITAATTSLTETGNMGGTDAWTVLTSTITSAGAPPTPPPLMGQIWL